MEVSGPMGGVGVGVGSDGRILVLNATKVGDRFVDMSHKTFTT